MKYSENYHLYLPEGSDFVSPEQYNNNFKTLDAKLKAVETQAGQVAGHTHAAGDILSGVFDESRIPIVPEGNRIVAKLGQFNTVDDLHINGEVKSYTIPFQQALEKLPKRVWVFFVNGTQEDLFTRPDRVDEDACWASLDMAYQTRFYEHLNAWVECCVGQGAMGTPIVSRQFVEDIRNMAIFTHTGSTTDDKNWKGFGGRAFTCTSMTNLSKSFNFSVQNFSYTKTGITFEIKAPNYANYGYQVLQFTAIGYAFDD